MTLKQAPLHGKSVPRSKPFRYLQAMGPHCSHQYDAFTPHLLIPNAAASSYGANSHIWLNPAHFHFQNMMPFTPSPPDNPPTVHPLFPTQLGSHTDMSPHFQQEMVNQPFETPNDGLYAYSIQTQPVLSEPWALPSDAHSNSEILRQCPPHTFGTMPVSVVITIWSCTNSNVIRRRYVSRSKRPPHCSGTTRL